MQRETKPVPSAIKWRARKSAKGQTPKRKNGAAEPKNRVVVRMKVITREDPSFANAMSFASTGYRMIERIVPFRISPPWTS